MKVYTKDPTKGHDVLVGEYDKATNTLTIPKHPGKHFMRIVQGYGIQVDVYDKVLLRRPNIVIKADKEYFSTINDWVKYGITADYGHGPQRFLPIKYMKTKDENVA